MNRLERVLKEMEVAKMDSKQFLELAEQYEDEGEHRMSEIAWLGYKLALQQFHDASCFYKKIAVGCGNTQTA